jgi:hypothetical protein
VTGPWQGRSPTGADRHPLAAAEASTTAEAEPEAGTRPRRVEESGGEIPSREPPLPTAFDEESGPNRPSTRLEGTSSPGGEFSLEEHSSRENSALARRRAPGGDWLEGTSLGARGADSARAAERKEDEGLEIAAMAAAAVPATAQPPPDLSRSSALPAEAAMKPPVATSPPIGAQQPASRREAPSTESAPPAEARVNYDGGGWAAVAGAARGAPGVGSGDGRGGRSITLEGMLRIAHELGQAAARACPPWRSRTKAGTCITSHDLRSVFMNRVEPDSKVNMEAVFPGGATFHPNERYPELYLEEDPDAIITYRWDMCLVSELPRFLEQVEEELWLQLGRKTR